jgi:hypothetical protein
MRKRSRIGAFILAAATILAAIVAAQDRIIIELIGKGGKGAIAVPDFRGAGGAQGVVATFNSVLWNELISPAYSAWCPRRCILAGSATAAGMARRSRPGPNSRQAPRRGAAPAPPPNLPECR